MCILKLQVKKDPGLTRILLVALLVFLENFITPLNTVLQTGAWPSLVYVAGCLTQASLQVITLLLAFVEQAPESTGSA